MALPSGYRQLEYIEFPQSGTPYIDTNFRTNQNTRLVIDFYLPSISTSDYVTIFGGRDKQGSSLRSFCFWRVNDSTTFRSDYGSNTVNINTGVNNGHFLLDKNGRTTTMTNVDTDTEYTGTNSSTTFTTTSQLYLFNINSLERIDDRVPKGMKIYNCQIYNGTTLQRDFVPGQRTSDDVVGLYDVANNVFYGPSGSGTFIAGPIVMDIRMKIDNNWKSADSAYIKVDGIWKSVDSIKMNANGWKDQ